ncbi:uncharacterized protein MELLADRAFT_109967 [Melampsora larici-populina 98AG31]|uniref:Uncharacterized protein n=1 Tax=Melampsora larici-populina (strain 98AG31 / pathotype 3-4-7) TaxID=747676 RepID=F4RY77_MELLP|nr:uncharacterized protein MELLADRAFT_109967 [Melampsora larici-populina 98AG31]EGG02684.1 hypothetical protein MELLADRAFT_109967 [Melampsora larici-populina 98AG31]
MNLSENAVGTIHEKYFEVTSLGPDGPTYWCTACSSGRTMKTYDRHRKSKVHKDNVEIILAEERMIGQESTSTADVTGQEDVMLGVQTMDNEEPKVVCYDELYSSDNSDNTSPSDIESEVAPPEPWSSEYRDYFALKNFDWMLEKEKEALKSIGIIESIWSPVATDDDCMNEWVVNKEKKANQAEEKEKTKLKKEEEKAAKKEEKSKKKEENARKKEEKAQQKAQVDKDRLEALSSLFSTG